MTQEIQKIKNIQNNIFTIRGLQVMIDRDLAEIYGVETRRLNEQVKRNIDRFPEEFMFQLSKEEMENWKSQIAISNRVKMGLRKPPLAFTEQGVSMLSAVLKSDTAVKVSIMIINAFVNMRKFILHNASLFQRINNLEQKQILTDIKQFETNNKIDKVLNALENKEILLSNEGIFYDGQIFDAYKFVIDIIKSAKSSIVLIDNYVDESLLLMCAKRKANVDVTIYTAKISKQLKLDLQKFNEQYEQINIKEYKKSHDRFLIIDDKTIYHIGASLKDLGKKWFAFSKINIDAYEMLSKLKD